MKTITNEQRSESYYARVDPDRRRWGKAVSKWFKACELRTMAHNEHGTFRQHDLNARRNRLAAEAVALAPELFKVIPGHASPRLSLVCFESPYHLCHETQRALHVENTTLELAICDAERRTESA